MTVQATLPTPGASLAEQRVYLEGVSWQQYESLISTLGDGFPALRMSYLDGTLEIMTNSPLHERLKTIIGMLIEAYLQESRIRFYGIGSATFRKEAKQRGLEPDECYCIGEDKPLPDLAIEVVLSSGIVDKFDIYRGLGIREICVWEADRFTLYQLCEDGYEQIEKSELLPGCNIELLTRHILFDDKFDAIMSYRDALRK